MKRPVARAARPARSRRGFTLIELALALTITGILLTLAAIVYDRMANKARFTQARTALKHLQKTETLYFTEHGRYTDNTVLLDFDPTRYDYYEISAAVLDNGLSFEGTATGIRAMEGDLWRIDRDGDPFQDNAAKAKFGG
jgi:prepilin-type N-terminal cleavage/methylation domain-containing protein